MQEIILLALSLKKNPNNLYNFIQIWFSHVSICFGNVIKIIYTIQQSICMVIYMYLTVTLNIQTMINYKRTLHTSTWATPFPSRLLCHSRQPASPGPKTPHPYLLVEYLLSVKYFNVQMLKFVIKSNSCKFVEVWKSNL